ncbi:MAG: right-handed parallel beta-helix repeat-containing protein [Deltaproteobacteria bacterium]|nr:right-handed parallel beta-helix repeat-containing protein [Deltaproteobacteria bacterium]
MGRLELRMPGTRFSSLTVALLVAMVPLQAIATDGVIAINQAVAVHGGATPGDTPGFPVTISQPGSYRLVGNLVVGSDAHVIEITSDHVSLDLAGFSVVGFGSGSSSGIHIPDSHTDVEIRNGSVRDAGNSGIRSSDCSGCRIIDVRASGNGWAGVLLSGQGGLIQGCTAISNGNAGLYATDGSTFIENVTYANTFIGIFHWAQGGTIVGNTSYSNSNKGISARGGGNSIIRANSSYGNSGVGIDAQLGSSVLDNAVAGNSGYGLDLGADGGYGRNVLENNTGGTADAGTQMGTNVCNGSPICP